MKIKIVTPIISEGFNPAAIKEFTVAARPDNHVENTFISSGPASIESEFDEALAVPATLAAVKQAEEDGFDAVVINCMGDPGLKPAREIVRIPVLGPAESSMHLAAQLGQRFSVVTVLDSVVPALENLARIYGVDEKLASVRVVNIPVLELDADRARMVRALIDESTKAVELDGAAVIIFGCTGMAGVAREIQDALLARGLSVPVIDTAIYALKQAEVLVDLGLAHSKRTYAPPPRKVIKGYPAFGPAPVASS